jgi:hypothetical protein
VLLAVGGLALALWFFTARDDATTSGPPVQAPGEAYRGPAPHAADLRRGNVVLDVRVSDAIDTAAVLSRDLGDPRDADLRAAGQAVLLAGLAEPSARARGQGGRALVRCDAPCPQIVAYARGRRLTVDSSADPRLRAFVEYWLGRSSG